MRESYIMKTVRSHGRGEVTRSGAGAGRTLGSGSGSRCQLRENHQTKRSSSSSILVSIQDNKDRHRQVYKPMKLELRPIILLLFLSQQKRTTTGEWNKKNEIHLFTTCLISTIIILNFDLKVDYVTVISWLNVSVRHWWKCMDNKPWQIERVNQEQE